MCTSHLLWDDEQVFMLILSSSLFKSENVSMLTKLSTDFFFYISVFKWIIPLPDLCVFRVLLLFTPSQPISCWFGLFSFMMYYDNSFVYVFWLVLYLLKSSKNCYFITPNNGKQVCLCAF